MGISTVASYTGAQLFQAIGISQAVLDEYFTGLHCPVGGIDLDDIAADVAARHQLAYLDRPDERAHRELEVGGEYQWRREGEYHLFNPDTVFKLQHSTRTGQYSIFKEYTKLIDDQSERIASLRGLLTFADGVRPPVPIDEVEPASEIVKRFSTGAMSYGSISAEAHETLAIAMNRLGARSNSGEGGEAVSRFDPDANGDWRRSAIKQVASGRFGVTSNYLTNCTDIQIKMAQGAKPGEGGQLPGHKVYPWVAEVRHSTPGVGLISPPPHHDIYSIEDLAQLIYDLKNANPAARIHVKLVSENGVGTVAAGVSKAHADVVLISGHDGGTGATPLTSMKHAGAPWELGLAETQQTLLLNGLRDRIVVQVDGQLKTGRDVVVAALLGAEEFGFATAPLVVSGCIMMRVCHLDTCPVGVATQNPVLRERFTGQPEFVENFFMFIAEEVRELMAKLGFRTVNEMVGQVNALDTTRAAAHWKAHKLDLTPVLHEAELGVHEPGPVLQFAPGPRSGQGAGSAADPQMPRGAGLGHAGAVRDEDRQHQPHGGHHAGPRGDEGLRRRRPAGRHHRHHLRRLGRQQLRRVPAARHHAAGATATPTTMSARVCPVAGSCCAPPSTRRQGYVAEDNIIGGNVILFGATSGEAFIRGTVGERFAVRNSGAHAVVEGVGDHGCEYMTGGKVVILGPTGRNFAAGMSGGIAYVYDPHGNLAGNLNTEMVDLETLDDDDLEWLRDMLVAHRDATDSAVAQRILADWPRQAGDFVKVMPRDYKRVLEAIAEAERTGADVDEAIMAASRG